MAGLAAYVFDGEDPLLLSFEDPVFYDKMERARRCFAGAITAPAGLEAATPVVLSIGAAAEPTGFGVASCGCFMADCGVTGSSLCAAG